MALKLFDSLFRAGLSPDVRTYSSAILACFKGQQASLALTVAVYHTLGLVHSTLTFLFYAFTLTGYILCLGLVCCAYAYGHPCVLRLYGNLRLACLGPG